MAAAPFKLHLSCRRSVLSSAEIAIVSADRAHIRDLAAAGNRGARLVEDFLIAPHQLLSATLLGTQMAVVLQTVVWTLWLHAHHPRHVELWLLVGLTPAVVILGEIVPKRSSVSMQIDLRRCGPALGGADAGLGICRRLSAGANFEAGGVATGIDVHHKLVTREDPKAWSVPKPNRRGQRGVAIGCDGRRAFDDRSHFDFPSLRADDVMKPLSDVVAQAETASVADLAREIGDKSTADSIYRERLDRIVGVVHAFDVLKSGRSDDGKTKDLMREPIMRPKRVRRSICWSVWAGAPGHGVIVDEYGGAVGLAQPSRICWNKSSVT